MLDRSGQLLDLGYIGEFELVDDHRGGKIVVELTGRLNKTGVISPRYNIGVGELEAWTARLLPSRQVRLSCMRFLQNKFSCFSFISKACITQQLY
jgi:ribosomal protein S8